VFLLAGVQKMQRLQCGVLFFADRRAKDAKIANIFPTIRGPGKTQKTKKQKNKTKRKTKQA
jgi:hypothetical protein